MRLLYVIGKLMVLFECAVGGMMSWSFINKNLQLHPLFQIILTVVSVILCFVILSKTNIICKIAQIVLGVIWGYFMLSPLILSFVEKPDMIWKIGILIISVIVCVFAQFLFAAVSEANSNI